MTFPLSFWEVSLLITITVIILLITSELLSPHYGKINVRINKRRLRKVTQAFSIVFLVTVAIRIIGIALNT
jgi:hypothetical protein